MAWTKPITDRTQSDVEYARAHRDSPSILKGARNYTDLQRWTGNIHHLKDMFNSLGFNIAVTCKTSWTLGEVPPRAEINKIRDDLTTLRSVYAVLPTTPPTPALPYINYQKMNDIEKILLDIEQIIQGFSAAVIHSGTTQSGNTGGYRV